MQLFEQMKSAADAALEELRADSLQVLVVKTENGEITVFENDLSSTREAYFLSEQKETLAALLCVWANGQIDLPSMNIRKRLIEINPKNADAVVYLQGKEIIPRPLSQTI